MCIDIYVLFDLVSITWSRIHYIIDIDNDDKLILSIEN